MSRQIGVLNLAQAASAGLEPIILVKFAFDTPVFVHTGIGDLPFDGDVYKGVGTLGEVGGVDESERLSPTTITFALSGVVPANITEGLDAGNYGDRITAFYGYRNAGGDLVQSPWILAGGTYEFADITMGGKENAVIVTMQHDISRLADKSGKRYTDEDQRQTYPDDEFFSFVHSIAGQKLPWGGQIVRTGGGGGSTRGGGGGDGSGSRDD